jgi:hypothetical protein
VVVVPVHHVILTRLRESKGMLCNWKSFVAIV